MLITPTQAQPIFWNDDCSLEADHRAHPHGFIFFDPLNQSGGSALYDESRYLTYYNYFGSFHYPQGHLTQGEHTQSSQS